MEVLLVGNTDFITKQWIQHAFPQDHVVIAEREGTVDGNDRLRIVNMSDASTLAETLTTYEFDRIVFFSEDLTPRSDRDGDLGTLRRLLHAIRNRQTQMLMVSGPEVEFTYPENADVRDTSKSLMSRALEELCLYYARTYQIEVKIIRSPYLYAPDRNGVTAYFNTLFEQAESGALSFHERKSQKTCFLCADDLAELIYRIFDDWTADSEIFRIPNVSNFTYGDLAEVIGKAFPGMSVTYGNDRPQRYPDDDHALRLRYGWSPRYSLKQDLPPVLQRWKEARAQEQSEKHPIWDFLRNHSKPWIAIEIFITFILEELLRTAVQGNSQLGTVDLRLFFVVIVGTMYGLNAGVFAAALACAGMALSYASKGASFAPLFYDTSNWLAFVVNLYFQNLFTIMCGLVESAMVCAFDYEDVARQSMLVPGTEFLNAQAFLPKVLAANELKHDHMGDHLLLRVEDAWQDDGSRLRGAIRQTDETGVLQDGNVYVLMNQASEHELPIINRRLTQAGLHVTRVCDQEEDTLLAEASAQVAVETRADETPRNNAAPNDSASHEGGAA